MTCFKRPLLIVLLVVFFVGALATKESHAQSTEDTFTLENDKATATFDKHGLASLRNAQLGKRFSFARDAFSITIGGQSFQSENLPVPDVSQGEHKVTYAFETPAYGIEVVYELEPEWQFISKQLFVTPSHQQTFTVNEVRVLRLRLEEEVAGQYVPRSRRQELGLKEYGTFLRFQDDTGMLALVQNPFLKYQRDGQSFSIAYEPDMKWKSEYGPFRSDRGNVGIYALSGERYATELRPEWKWERGDRSTGEKLQYWSEINAFTECVEQFIMEPHADKPLDVHVGWTENDYQIDVATESGREVYKRIIDQSADLGVDHIVYAPYNSLLGDHLNTTDDWNWENLLWLGLGKKVRKGQWDPESDPIPSSVQKMLDYAGSQDVSLMAYVYPSLPFDGNSEWIRLNREQPKWTKKWPL